MKPGPFVIAGLLALLAGAPAAHAQQPAAPRPELLWPGGAPGALGQADADQPTITPYLPAAGQATGTAVVIFPGGGYGHLAMDHEGEQVARWLNSLGVAGFVVKYRLGPRYHHPVMLTDAQRAIRTVRAKASQWGVDPARIGIIGFSAGGHLASTAGTHFDAGKPGAADPLDAAGSRPDFMMLIYPVITLGQYTHRGSLTNLLGAQPDPALVEFLSNEKQVTARTPPTFLVHTSNDAAVPVENSIMFYQALHAAGVPAEMHVYEAGPHGFGLAPRDPVLATWPGLAEKWMARRNLLGAERARAAAATK